MSEVKTTSRSHRFLPRWMQVRSLRIRIRDLASAAGVVAIATVAGVVLSGGTAAMWVSQSSFTAGTVQSGSAQLRIVSSFDSAAWGKLIPGESVRQPFTVVNDGNIPLLLSAAGSTQSGGFELRAATGSCPTAALSGPSITSTSTSLGTLGAGASATMCLEVRLGTAASPGSTSTVSVTVTGSQS